MYLAKLHSWMDICKTMVFYALKTLKIKKFELQIEADKYLSWIVLCKKSSSTFFSPNGIGDISFMPNKCTFITKVVEFFMFWKV